MKRGFLAVVLMLTLFEPRKTFGLKLQLFNSPIPYQGLTYDREEAKYFAPELCQNIEKYGQVQASSVLTDSCIIAYEKENCEGHSFRVNPPGNGNFLKTISSYHVCNSTDGGEKIKVDLYDFEGAFVMRYTDLCGCESLPKTIANISSLNNHGNCITLYEGLECPLFGAQTQIPAGSNDISDDLSKLSFRPGAIGPCGPSATCIKLEAKIFQFDIDFHKAMPAFMRSEELASKATFYNNGSGIITQEYHASKPLRQKYSVKRSAAITGLTFSTLSNALTKNLNQNSRLSPEVNSIISSVSAALQSTYSPTRYGRHSQDERYEYVEDKMFSVRQTIQIPPCEEYSVSSTLSISDNYPISYAAHARVSGTNRGVPIPATELERYAKDLKLVKILDEYTAIFKTVGEEDVRASFGVETSIKGEGTRITGCPSDSTSPVSPPPPSAEGGEDFAECRTIVGGCAASSGEFPSQVFIRIRPYPSLPEYTTSCGGSILSPTHILTAAHCFHDMGGELYEDFTADVIAGVTDINISQGRQTRPVLKTWIHEGYDNRKATGNGNNYNNDIAILVLDKPLTFSARIKATRLPSKMESFASDTNLTVTGWGRTMEGGPASDKLLKVQVSLVGQDVCRKNYTQSGISISDNMICASARGKDACEGDSGGPALCKRGRGSCYNNGGNISNCVQCGIVSFGKGCARPNYPGVYTNVAKYLDWISRIMNEKKANNEADCPYKHQMEEEWMHFFHKIFHQAKDRSSS